VLTRKQIIDETCAGPDRRPRRTSRRVAWDTWSYALAENPTANGPEEYLIVDGRKIVSVVAANSSALAPGMS
jgi:hypothetical protein